MKHLPLSLLVLAHVISATDCSAATVGPTDCSAAAVNAAIATASDGDTINLTCTGTVAWTTTVSIPATKGITLAVQGGTNTPKSAAVFPLTVTSALTDPTIRITVGPGKALSRLSGFKFQNSGTAGDSGFLRVSGCGVGTQDGIGGFRLDNNYFDTISGNAVIVIGSTCPALYGLIDNNTMHDAWRADNVLYGPYGIEVWNWWHNGNGCWGEDGWTSPLVWGDKNWVFIEDNLFENLTAGRYMRHYLSSELGGRYVARYNTFTVNVQASGNKTDLIEGHGLCLCYSNGTSNRGSEVYRNTFSGSEMGRIVMPRGGQWLIYDNTFSTLGSWPSPIWLMEYRAGNSGMSSQCSASCPCAAPLGFTWRAVVTDGSYYPLPQQVSGTYVWNNLYNGINQAPAVDDRGVQQTYIQAGRDYFASAGKPAALSSYSPYTYPHPLRKTDGDTLAPAPPRNLRRP